MLDNFSGLAKSLRKRQTEAEKLLWWKLKGKQLEGVKFRRQAPIGSHIVDFVSFEKKLILEIDGVQHALQKDKDEARECWLAAQGFKILRFWNNEVLQNLDGVLEVIRENI